MRPLQKGSTRRGGRSDAEILDLAREMLLELGAAEISFVDAARTTEVPLAVDIATTYVVLQLYVTCSLPLADGLLTLQQEGGGTRFFAFGPRYCATPLPTAFLPPRPPLTQTTVTESAVALAGTAQVIKYCKNSLRYVAGQIWLCQCL